MDEESLKKERTKLRRHLRDCPRGGMGVFCGFCDVAYDKIEEINSKLRFMRSGNSQKGKRENGG